MLLFLNIPRKDGISWRQFRAEGVSGQRNISLGLADAELLAAGLCYPEGNHRLRGAASAHGWAIPRPRLELCVPQYRQRLTNRRGLSGMLRGKEPLPSEERLERSFIS